MEKIFDWIIHIIAMFFELIGALLYVIWKFEFNPVLEEGTKNGYYYKPWDYKLWDWWWYGNKPQYRGIK